MLSISLKFRAQLEFAIGKIFVFTCFFDIVPQLQIALR